jgi:hypothetical protein
MAASVLAEALVRWQHAAGPFWPYVCAAPFLGAGPGAEALPGDGQRRWTRQQRVLVEALTGEPLTPRPPPPCAGEGEPADDRGEGDCESVASRLPLSHGRKRGPGGEGLSILLVDLPPEPVLTIAPLLVEQGWYVVPVVQRWIASPAVLPCRRLLDVLVRGARRARRPKIPRGAVLVADGARAGPAGYPALAPGRAFDNRYEYQICRFPSLDFLRAQEVRRGRWITRQAGGIVSQDLAPYLEELLRAGIEVDVVPWSPLS